MSKTVHENRVLASVEAINSGIDRGYTETLIFPGYDLGVDADFYFEGHPTLRGEILAMGVFNVTEVLDDAANGDATIQVGIIGTDADEYIEAITGGVAGRGTAELAANTNDATDADAARDLTRELSVGDAIAIPADQLVGATGTQPTGTDGIFDVYVTVRWFT